MNFIVERDGMWRPWRPGPGGLRGAAPTEEAFAAIGGTSLVSASAREFRSLSGAERLVAWSGSMAEIDEDGDRALFEAHPRTWAGAGWAAMEAGCERALAGSRGVLLVRPHARHVLSDVPSLKRFGSLVADRWAGRVELFFDPASLIDASHLERHDAADVYTRLIEEAEAMTIGPAVAAFVAANVVRRGDRTALAPIEAGELPAGLIVDAARRLGRNARVALIGEEQAQAAVLGG